MAEHTSELTDRQISEFVGGVKKWVNLNNDKDDDEIVQKIIIGFKIFRINELIEAVHAKREIIKSEKPHDYIPDDEYTKLGHLYAEKKDKEKKIRIYDSLIKNINEYVKIKNEVEGRGIEINEEKIKETYSTEDSDILKKLKEFYDGILFIHIKTDNINKDIKKIFKVPGDELKMYDKINIKNSKWHELFVVDKENHKTDPDRKKQLINYLDNPTDGQTIPPNVKLICKFYLKLMELRYEKSKNDTAMTLNRGSGSSRVGGKRRKRRSGKKGKKTKKRVMGRKMKRKSRRRMRRKKRNTRKGRKGSRRR